jgi:hypothetical protein
MPPKVAPAEIYGSAEALNQLKFCVSKRHLRYLKICSVCRQIF